MALMLSSGAAYAFEADSASGIPAAAKPKKEYRTVVYDVHLHCESCVKKVRENISFEKGIKALEVSLADQTVTATYDTSKTDETKIADAIKKLSYEVKSVKKASDAK